MKIFINFLLIIIFLGIILFLYIKLNPVLGWKLTKEKIIDYTAYKNFSNWKFDNIEATQMMVSSPESDNNWTFSFLKSNAPTKKIEVTNIDFSKIKSTNNNLVWFWHSSFYLKLDNKNILIDPVYSNSVSPVPLGKFSRFENSSDIFSDITAKLPNIDIVFITHNHYDHLDYDTIKSIDSKVKYFYVPLWVSKDLLRWWISQDKIKEFYWDDETNYDWLDIRFNTSRHFSGRNLSDRNTSLWWSWIIKSKDYNLYFSWDSWYWSHFKEIWNKYWPFDYAFIEWAQYDKAWPNIHMFPEQSVQASKDLNAKKMMLIHYWAFDLSNHNWNDPIIRWYDEAQKQNVFFVCPEIWEDLDLSKENKCENKWWLK